MGGFDRNQQGLTASPHCFRGSNPKSKLCPTCRDQTDPTTENIKQCVVNEKVSREMMIKEWSQFTHRDKANCRWETSLDKSPSYINLYTCLGMEAANRKASKGKMKNDF